MVKQLFVLGCPGSGKSTISRYIEMLARDRGWSARSINDYENLYWMFQADTKYGRFRAVAFGGFDILDPYIRDTALKELKEEAQSSCSANTNELVLIEFSRCNYNKALKLFGKAFLCDAHFLFLDVDGDTCIRRVRERVVHPHSLNDHFVSDYVIDCFSRERNRQYVESELKLDYKIADDRVCILDNGGSLKEVAAYIKQIIDTLLPVPVSASS